MFSDTALYGLVYSACTSVSEELACCLQYAGNYTAYTSPHDIVDGPSINAAVRNFKLC